VNNAHAHTQCADETEKVEGKTKTKGAEANKTTREQSKKHGAHQWPHGSNLTRSLGSMSLKHTQQVPSTPSLPARRWSSSALSRWRTTSKSCAGTEARRLATVARCCADAAAAWATTPALRWSWA
jgi:hypothetical protein